MPASWGLSPTFRVFLFLGGLFAVLAFLLYNEYLINQFREQERDRAGLYASFYGLAISEGVPTELTGYIFDKVIDNESISFPMVVTDHRGKILNWKGPGLPAYDDTSATALAQVRTAMGDMDAVNEPIDVKWSSEANTRVYTSGHNLIFADPGGYAAVWSGPDLPPYDTADEARAAGDAALARSQATGRKPLVFRAPADTVLHLVHAADDFAVALEGRVIAWGGPGLPAFPGAAATVEAEGRVDTAAAQAFYAHYAADAAPLAFRVQNVQFIHFGDTQLIGRLSAAPFVTVGVLLLFVVIGWVGSRNIRRSEQRSIWVGMAKETAHQLGTPLSSLSGWLELMDGRVHNLAQADGARRAQAVTSVETTVREMQRDMGRLTQIASRFSLIGSVPELTPSDVREVVAETVRYFQGRGPQFGRHDFEFDPQPVPKVPLNAELMGWAFENLFKNAIDAMVQQEGCIRVSTAFDTERDCVRILVADNGRGIEAENLGRVFQPGFSTKKRGWGLGLAFVRRIVEEYHGGHIHIPRSEPGAGTTFEINLPVEEGAHAVDG